MRQTISLLIAALVLLGCSGPTQPAGPKIGGSFSSAIGAAEGQGGTEIQRISYNFSLTNQGKQPIENWTLAVQTNQELQVIDHIPATVTPELEARWSPGMNISGAGMVTFRTAGRSKEEISRINPMVELLIRDATGNVIYRLPHQ